VCELKSQRVGFYLYSPTQIQSFLASGVLKEISKDFNLEIFVKPGLSLSQMKKFSGANLREGPKIPILVRKFSGYVQMVTLWKFKDRSMNHTVRAFASFGTNKQRKDWSCVVVSEMHVNFLKRLLVKVLSASLFFKVIRSTEHLLFRLALRVKFTKVFRNLDFMIIPFSGHIGADFNTLVWTCKKLGIVSLALQENWDNLSTKTFITEEPNVFGVWGEQSAGHIRSVHKLRECSVEIIGSSRFKKYFTSTKLNPMVWSPASKKPISLNKKPYFLIGGTGDGADDELLIDACFKAINLTKKKIKVPSLEIVYRPHPDTRTSRNLDELTRLYPGLMIDAGDRARAFGHHNALVQNCRALINHFSTLSVEGLICNRFVVVPLFLGRSSANYRYEHILNEWHHILGLRVIPSLYTPKSLEELAKTLYNLTSETAEPQKSNWEWICQPTNYSKRIKEIIEAFS
jgi:hypothetical protein